MADASESSAPFSTSSTATEESWARLARAWGVVDGIVPSTVSFDPPDLKVTATGTTTVSIAAGEASVSGFYYRNSSAIVRNVPTNASSATQRTDHVVIESNQSTNEVTVRYIAGGASIPPLTKSITGAWQMRIAEIRIPAGGSVATAANTFDRRQFIGPQSITVPAGYVPPVVLGQMMQRPDGLFLGTVTGWEQLWPKPTPSWTAVDPSGSGTFSAFAGGFTNRGGAYFNCAFTKVDSQVYFRGWFKATTTKALGSTLFILPEGYRPSQQVSLPAINAGRIDIATSGSVLVADAMVNNDVAGLDGLRFFVA